MKKITYLVAPLMVMPFLLGCNKVTTHKVVGVEGLHLDFTTMNGKELKDSAFNEGQDFKFKVKAAQESGELSTTYTVLPEAIGIYVGNSTMPLLDGYNIEFTKADNTEAIITIEGSKVTSDIYVEGIAKKANNFIYNVVLTNDVVVGNKKSIGYMEKVTSTGENGTLPFEGVDVDHPYPTKECFAIATSNSERVYITGDTWFNAHVEVDTAQASENKSTLKIKDIASSDTMEYLFISARSNTSADSFLDSLGWDDIREYAYAGYAPYLFNIGDKKKVTIGLNTYEVRLIGFNHDVDGEENILPLTFQFVEAISNNTTAQFIPSVWNSNENNNQFPEASLNTVALPDLFEVLPDDLKRNISETKKEVGTHSGSWILSRYKTKLFPLSHAEMSTGASQFDKDGEGSIYQYYSTHTGEDNRIVKDIAGNTVMYWLRTPTITVSGRAWAVDVDGDWRYNSQSVSTTHAVVPAFCI